MEMKKIIPLLVFLIISTSIVSAERPYDKVAEATFEALKSGDYLILHPYLDDVMKTAFNEEKFKAFRDDLISKYGELKSYSFVREGKVSGFILGYYNFEFERADVTLRLVFREVNSEYLLSGIWIDAVNSKEGIPLGVAVLFPVLGGFLALLTFYILGFRRIGVAEIIFGIILVAITLGIQPLIQNAPFLAVGIKSNSEVIAKGTGFMILTAIWLGFVAGFFQESLKYGLSKGKYLNEALFIGIGFGLGEAILVPALQAIQLSALGGITPRLTTALVSMLERYLATLFHAGTTVVLAYSYKNGFGKKALLSLSIVHGIIDTFAAYYQFRASAIVLAITYVLLLAVSLFLLRYGLPKVKEEREEDRIVW